jgi:hypothetical protein
LVLLGLVAAFVVVAGAHRPSFAAVAPGPTPVCDLPDGDVVWTATASPYLICPDGLWIGAATRLTIDAQAGPVEVRATGQGGVLLHGELRTTNTSATKRVLFAPLTATAPGAWDGIAGGGRATLTDTTIRLASSPLWVGSFDASRITVESSPSTAITGRGTIVDSTISSAGPGADFGDPEPASGILSSGPVVARNVTFTDLADSAVVHHRADLGPLVVEGSRFTRVGTSGVPAVIVDGVYGLGDQRPIIRDNVFTSSSLGAGGGAARAPAIEIHRMWVDLATEVVRNTGRGNGLNAILLNRVWTPTGFTWTSPHDALLDAPLGLVTTALTVQDGVVAVPAGGVVKVLDGGIELIRSRLTAGPLATFTSARDNTAGVALCPSTITATCTPSPDDWRGLSARGSIAADPAISFDGATLRHAVEAIVVGRWDGAFPAGSTTVSLTDSTIEQVRAGVRAEGAGRIAITRGTIRDVAGGTDPFWNGPILGRAVEATGAGGLAIDGTTVRNIRGEAVWVNGGPLRVSGATLQQTGLAGRSAIYAIFVTDPDLTNTTITDSGTGGPGRPAVHLSAERADLGRGLVGLRGAGNGIDAVVLSVRAVTGDLTWVTPRTNAVTAPLGYVNDDLTFTAGATVTVPAGGVVHSTGRMRFQGAHLDAGAGGSAFTTVEDPQGGAVACVGLEEYVGSLVRATPGCAGSRWSGIALEDAADGARSTAIVQQSRLRRATEVFWIATTATSSRWSPSAGVLLDGVVVEDSWAGAFLGNGNTSVVGSTFRRLESVGIVAGGRGVTSVAGNTIEDVPTGLSLSGPAGGRVEVTGNTVRRVTNVSMDVHDASNPVVRDNAFAGPSGWPLVRIQRSTIDLGDLIGNTATGGTGPAVTLLDGVTLQGDGGWVTPQEPSPTPVPVGFAIGAEDVVVGRGAVLRLPAGAVVRSILGALWVTGGGRVDATAGGAVFTTAGDTTVAAPFCSIVPSNCPSQWRGLRVSLPDPGAPPSLVVRDGGVRHAAVAVTAIAGSAVAVPSRLAVDWQGGELRGVDGGVRVWDSGVRLDGVALTGASGAALEATNATVTITCSSVYGNGAGLRTLAGTTASVGQSNLTGNLPEVDAAAGTAVDARGNWWGQAGGPAPGQVTGAGAVDTRAPRTSRAACAPSYPSSFDGIAAPPATTTTTTSTSTTTTSTTVRPTTTTTPPSTTTTTTTTTAAGPPAATGYAMVDAGGRVHAFGDAPALGDAPVGAIPAVDVELTRTNRGYWVVDAAGHVFTFGDAGYFGGAGALRPRETVTSLSATPDGSGYWLFTTAGRVLAFGTAPFLGDMSATPLNGPVLDSVPTPSGRGYYLVASDGGIFTFGDARFLGSMGGTPLNAPVQSLVPDLDGTGYWLVASDGGIFTFASPFYGSMGSVPLNRPVTGMVGGREGYLMVAEDGGIFTFGDVAFRGSLGDNPPPRPVVAVAAVR